MIPSVARSAPLRLEGILAFEAALARALAEVGIVTPRHATIISECCVLGCIDADRVAREAPAAGNEAIPTIEQLRAVVARVDADAATYVHWGATSQDALDTALALSLRELLMDLERRVGELTRVLGSLAVRHADTVMVARTLMQQAAPTTFGFKVATWLDPFSRHCERIRAARDAVSILQLGGAVGTLAALGSSGPRVAELVAHDLGLGLAHVPWHAARDRVAEVAAVLGMVTESLGKIARDVALLSQSEIDEVREGGEPGLGRSSTLPQKRNPVGCAAVLASALRAPPLVATVLASMVNEHERGLGGWQAEWETLSTLGGLAGDALSRTTTMMRGLEVNETRMAANLDASRGFVFAEAVSFALIPRLGRDSALAVLRDAIHRATDRGTHLREELLQDPLVGMNFGAAEVTALFEAKRYLGCAPSIAREIGASAMASGELPAATAP